MGSENRFVYNPSTVDIKRSKFNMNSFWIGSIYHGDLVPVEITRIMPGDSAKYNLNVFLRTATPPIFPIMDTIRLSIAAFYVPDRLVWNKTKEFYGENTEGYGIQSEVLAPRSSSTFNTIASNAAVALEIRSRSLATYLGLVRQKTGSLTSPSLISLNPLRAYLQVYNDWFRNENFMPPYLWDHNQTGDGNRTIATIGGVSYSGQDPVPKVCKQLDRYTSCLPWAQKGDPVLIGMVGLAPLVVGEDSTFAPVVTDSSLHYMGTSQLKFSNRYLDDEEEKFRNLTGYLQATQEAPNGILMKGTTEPGAGSTDRINASNLGADLSNAYADLSQATANSINQFRLAFATQRYLEALARSGSKYREYILGIYGVRIGDTTAQMAEYLGGMTMELNVDQVLSTAGYAASGSTLVGAPGASSTSAASEYLFTKSFTEPGYLVVVAYTKHNRTYGQGIDEIYQKHEILEEYNPKFANIGEQAIRKNCLYFTGEAADDDTRFGFQEAWSEYRHKKDIVVGALNPANSSSFNFTNLADKYDSAPTLNADFLTEDRTAITRCLAGGSASPDYFLNIKFKREFVRPMPLYSIPGLIDHH